MSSKPPRPSERLTASVPFDVVPAHLLEDTDQTKRWLIEDLWAEQAVGILGGEPKSCKSILALQVAVAVASGKPALRRFHTPEPGRVLLYAAEDATRVVKERLCAIAHAQQTSLEALDIQVIAAPRVRLDLKDDQLRLRATVERLRPRILILDPLVRLHCLDENSSSDIATLLGALRDLQRRFQLAIMLVHHVRKRAQRLRPGQALRGSSDLHAWGDSNLYLRRRGEGLTLTVEHRAAPAPPDLRLELHHSADQLELRFVANQQESPANTLTDTQRILELLHQAEAEVPFTELRRRAKIRAQTFGRILRSLCEQGRVAKTPRGYRIAPT